MEREWFFLIWSFLPYIRLTPPIFKYNLCMSLQLGAHGKQVLDKTRHKLNLLKVHSHQQEDFYYYYTADCHRVMIWSPWKLLSVFLACFWWCCGRELMILANFSIFPFQCRIKVIWAEHVSFNCSTFSDS